MTILIHCPYGHDGKATQVDIKEPHKDKQTLAELYGIKCEICGRVFVIETHAYPLYGGIDYILFDYLRLTTCYEKDGKWEGPSIQLSEGEE